MKQPGLHKRRGQYCNISVVDAVVREGMVFVAPHVLTTTEQGESHHCCMKRNEYMKTLWQDVSYSLYRVHM